MSKEKIILVRMSHTGHRTALQKTYLDSYSSSVFALCLLKRKPTPHFQANSTIGLDCTPHLATRWPIATSWIIYTFSCMSVQASKESI